MRWPLPVDIGACASRSDALRSIATTTRIVDLTNPVGGPRPTWDMTELAYMVREHWAQRGTAMRQQSAVIREWLGNPPYIFATADRKKYEQANSADREFVT